MLDAKYLKSNIQHLALTWPRSTMDSIRVSEAPDTGSIPVEATSEDKVRFFRLCPFSFSSKRLA